MITWKLITGSLIMLLLTLGCGGVMIVITPAAPSPPLSFTPIPTFTPSSTSIARFTSQAPTTTLEQRIYNPFYIATSADNVNLRIMPGTLFPVSRLLAYGTRLKVLGHAPGGEWLYVQTDEQIFGWVLVALVNGGHDGGPTPLVGPQNVQLITGRVEDLLGIPIRGIGFAVTQCSGPKALRSDATTDDTGQFYAYLPISSGGQWLVSYVSVACTSNTMDANCNCLGGACGRAYPDSVTVSFPYIGVLHFVWK